MKINEMAGVCQEEGATGITSSQAGVITSKFGI